MGQGSNGLHFNGVTIFERVIQNSWGVHHLPTQVAMISMPDKERLGRESVRLDFNICPSDLVDEAGFADIGESTDKQCPGIWVNGRQTGEMLPDLLQILKTLRLPLHDGGHATQGCLLELLAAVQGVTVLEKADIIFGDIVNQMQGNVDLTKS